MGKPFGLVLNLVWLVASWCSGAVANQRLCNHHSNSKHGSAAQVANKGARWSAKDSREITFCREDGVLRQKAPRPAASSLLFLCFSQTSCRKRGKTAGRAFDPIWPKSLPVLDTLPLLAQRASRTREMVCHSHWLYVTDVSLMGRLLHARLGLPSTSFSPALRQ